MSQFTLSNWRVTSFIRLRKGILLYTSDSNKLNCSRITNSDGRCLDLLPSRGSEEATRKNSDPVAGQTYKIVFKTKEYFEHTNRKSFYPWVEVSRHTHTALNSYLVALFADHLHCWKRGSPSYPTVNQSLCLHYIQR